MASINIIMSGMATGIEEALTTWAVNNAPGVIIAFIFVAWLIWWGRGKLFEYESKFVAFEHRFERVDARLDRLEERMDRVETRLDRIEIQLLEMNHKLTALTSALIAGGKISPPPALP